MTDKPGFDIVPFRDIVAEMLREIGLNHDDCYVADGDYWEMWKGSAKVYVSLFPLKPNGGEEEWYMDISSPVIDLPSHSSLSFYRRLLEENANRVAVKFALRDNTVWCEITRELRGLTFDEAFRNLIRIGDASDEIDDIFRSEYFTSEG